MAYGWAAPVWWEGRYEGEEMVGSRGEVLPLVGRLFGKEVNWRRSHVTVHSPIQGEATVTHQRS